MLLPFLRPVEQAAGARCGPSHHWRQSRRSASVAVAVTATRISIGPADDVGLGLELNAPGASAMSCCPTEAGRRPTDRLMLLGPHCRPSATSADLSACDRAGTEIWRSPSQVDGLTPGPELKGEAGHFWAPRNLPRPRAHR